MACSLGARRPSELFGWSQASRLHVAGKACGHTCSSLHGRTAQAVAAASSHPHTQPRLVTECRDAASKGYVESRHGRGPFCCEQQQSVAGGMMSRRALGQCCLAAALASVAAGPRPSHAALVEDDVSMRVFDKASLSVVSIVNYSSKGGVRSQEGIGTGVVWDTYGHVVTNYHVISKVDKSVLSQATKVLIAGVDGKGVVECNVELAGTDAVHDLAVLRIVGTTDGSAPPLQPIALGRSADLKVGQYTFAIGNTFGLTRTLSAGIISGLNRSIPSPVGTRIYGMVQTDASISAGNSGGPLLDSSARMVALNTATFTRSGTGRGSGVNFALPADLLLDVVPKLIVYGNAMGKL